MNPTNAPQLATTSPVLAEAVALDGNVILLVLVALVVSVTLAVTVMAIIALTGTRVGYALGGGTNGRGWTGTTVVIGAVAGLATTCSLMDTSWWPVGPVVAFAVGVAGGALGGTADTADRGRPPR